MSWDTVFTFDLEKVFVSPTEGFLSLGEVVALIEDIIHRHQDEPHRLIIATDSQRHGQHYVFVSVIILHHVGHGARYFYHKETYPEHSFASLSERMFSEALRSVELAHFIMMLVMGTIVFQQTVEIHLDIGPKGKTKKYIKELVGLIMGNGFHAVIKPDGFGASGVANLHTK